MALQQPMGPGVASPKVMAKVEATNVKADLQERQAVIEATQLQAQLLRDPVLRILAGEMEATMLKAYLETPEGQEQIRLIKKFGKTLNPALISQRLRTRFMDREGLTGLMSETPAAP